MTIIQLVGQVTAFELYGFCCHIVGSGLAHCLVVLTLAIVLL